jgi:hypothetical protein
MAFDALAKRMTFSELMLVANALEEAASKFL